VRAFVLTKPHEVSLREWPEPTPSSNEALVAPLLIGVCGTDLELIDGTIDQAYVRYPLVLGHEWVGHLVQDVASLGPAGTRVVVEGVVPCRVCAQCARGATNLCATYDEIGFTRAGALGQLISVPLALAHTLEADVAIYDAVLVEPMAVVWRALTRLPLRAGLSVAILGDGTIALLAAHLVRLFEPARVSVFGRRPEQHDLALLAGAQEFNVASPTDTYDLVIEASGSIDAVASALACSARGAMVILLGLPPHGIHVELAPDDLVNNDVIIQGSFSYTGDAFGEVVRRVNTRELRPSFLITHRYELEQAPDAIAALRASAPGEPRGKVVIAVSSSSPRRSLNGV
jgi:threonine dehydrogenase-like Zn-dependent dehydrogenase